MASSDITVKLRKMPKTVTMTVRVIETREFKLRKWLALSLIKLACSVVGCEIDVQDPENLTHG